jgi:hypothetical protein
MTHIRPGIASLWAVVAFASVHEGASYAQPRPPVLYPSPAAHYPPGTHYKPLDCATPDKYGKRCFGQVLVDANDNVISNATSPPGGWPPNELQKAYGVPAATSIGNVTIATFIGSHYTNAESDMAVYRQMYGLPPCTSANGCFTQVTDSNGTDFSGAGVTDDGCSGTMGEEALDVTMLQAGCPSCKILIIEGNNNTNAAMTAMAHGAVSISMSWGYSPESQSDCDSQWTPPSGLALFAASGDSGYTATPGEPAACTHVVAVGWTQLATDSSARGYADTLPKNWGSAGGCDAAQTKGSWQTDPSCSTRMISDISANGDNVAVYCTSPAGSANWHVTGGSSASSPFTTGLMASAGITTDPSFSPAWLYAHESEFWDVTTGGPVGSCPGGSPDYYCNAIVGYDGPTGVGTPVLPIPGGSGVSSGSGSSGSSTSSGGNGSSSGGGSSGSGSSSGSTSGGSSGSSSGGGITGSSGSGSSSGGSGSTSGSGGNGGAPSGGSDAGSGLFDNTGSSSGCSCSVLGDRTNDRLVLSVVPALFALVGVRTRLRKRR